MRKIAFKFEIINSIEVDLEDLQFFDLNGNPLNPYAFMSLEIFEQQLHEGKIRVQIPSKYCITNEVRVPAHYDRTHKKCPECNQTVNV